jgi:peptide/nickel transport system permease protein
MAADEFLSGVASAGIGLEEDLLPRRGRHRLARWIARRLALGVLSLFFVSILIFIVTHVLPSDPARSILGHFAEKSQLDALNKALGLDRPVLSQYFSWIGGVLHGDLGVSYATRTPIAHTIFQRLENSLILVAIVAVIAVPLSMALGLLAATKRDRLVDHAVTTWTLGTAGLPEFVIGILLSLFFAVGVLHLFPAVNASGAENPLAHPDGMVLPVATLVIAVIPYLTRLMRGSMIEALDSSYVEMARLKGVPERSVGRRHAFRNALVPIIQGTALTLIYLLGNVVVVENLFNYPGLGQLFVRAVSVRDLITVQACALVFASMFILFNIIADLLTVYASPRLRTEM